MIARFLVAGAGHACVVERAEDLLHPLQTVTGLQLRYGGKG